MRTKGFVFTLLTGFHLMLSPLAQAANETEAELTTLESIQCKATEFANFCWKRIPNSNEIFADIVVVTPIDMAISYMGLDLGDDPISKAVIRDATKIISMAYKVFTDTKVGSTDFKFDSSNLYSQLSKVGIKVGGIAFAKQAGYDQKGIESFAKNINFPGDVVSRAVVKAGMDRQLDAKDEQAFHVYVFENANPYWLMQAVSEMIPKTIVMNVIGSLVVKSGIQTIAEMAPIFIFNNLMFTRLHPRRDVGTMFQNGALLSAQLPQIVAYPLAGFLGLSSGIFRGLTESYILATAARITMDGVDAFVKSGVLQTVYIWFFPANQTDLSEMSQEL